MMSNQVLVTGGAGFIGTHLCRALVQSGRKVRVLDLKTPAAEVIGVDYWQGDVRHTETVKKAVQDVDAVYHLAAIASVPVCQQQPYESSRTNLLSTALVLEHLPPKARFIFSSSAAVYGDLGKVGEPISEDLPLKDFLSFYAAQKYGSETLARQFHRSRGTQAVVFRFFNVYGPGQDPRSPYSGVISKFVDALEIQALIRLNGGGVPTRDFVSVHDLVRALLVALDCPGDVCTGEPINLGQGIPCSVRELAELMMEITGKKVPIEEAPWREGDVPHSRADIRRAYDRLSWMPGISLRAGLTELLKGSGF